MPGYYDVDDILAEEEIIPCQTTFHFSYLAHLNRDAAAAAADDARRRNNKDKYPNHVLPEDTMLQMPMWSIRTWADLGFVRVTTVPKLYRLATREWLAADATAVTLRPTFFSSGRALLHFLERSCHKQAHSWKKQTSSTERTAALQKLEALLQEAKQIRETILQTYTGARFRATFNGALSSVGDDVSGYVHKLTDLEKRLYRHGAISSANLAAWIHSSSAVHHIYSRRRRRGSLMSNAPPQRRKSSTTSRSDNSQSQDVTSANNKRTRYQYC